MDQLNLDQFETHWKDIRGNVRPHWPALTDAEVNLIDGHVDVLIDLLEEKYSYSRFLAEDELNRFLQEMRTVQSN